MELRMIEIQTLLAVEARQYFDQMADVYADAFAQAPYFESLGDLLVFSGRLPFHARWQGFKCVIARSETDHDRIIGFGYGVASQLDTWWHDQVAVKMSRDMADEWLSDCFEFVELAVYPAYQGLGIGGKLHNALLSGVRQRTAVLSTPQVETNALYLYRKRGWIPLLENFNFPGFDMNYCIMGLQLNPT